MVSATRSRWGQRLGQKKAASEISNLCKQKDPKPWLNSDKELITYQLLADGFRGAYGQIPSDF